MHISLVGQVKGLNLVEETHPDSGSANVYLALLGLEAACIIRIKTLLSPVCVQEIPEPLL